MNILNPIWALAFITIALTIIFYYGVKLEREPLE